MHLCPPHKPPPGTPSASPGWFISKSGALIVEYDGYRYVYPAENRFTYRQPPHDFVPLGGIIPFAVLALVDDFYENLPGRGGAC